MLHRHTIHFCKTTWFNTNSGSCWDWTPNRYQTRSMGDGNSTHGQFWRPGFTSRLILAYYRSKKKTTYLLAKSLISDKLKYSFNQSKPCTIWIWSLDKHNTQSVNDHVGYISLNTANTLRLRLYLSHVQKYEADQAKAEKAAAESASKQSSRGGKFKAAKSDTMPSKYAERVEPTIPTHKITKTKSVVCITRITKYKYMACSCHLITVSKSQRAASG